VLALELVDERVQLLGLKEPPLPPSLHDTEPVGEEGEEAESVTEAVNVIVPPVDAEDGFGDTLVEVVCRAVAETVRDALPEPGEWLESPGYAAVTVTVPPGGGLGGAVYVTLHELALELVGESTQVEELKDPPAPPSLQDNVPEGAEGEELVSVIFAVSTEDAPGLSDDGFDETRALTGALGWLTVSVELPELLACVESPE